MQNIENSGVLAGSNVTEKDNLSIDSSFVEASKINDDEFFSLLDNSLSSSNIDKNKQVVKGTIIEVNDEKGYVLVDTGLKSESVVMMKEFFRDEDKKEIQVGSSIDVYLSFIDQRQCGSVVSKERAIRESSWSNIVKAHANGEPIEGIIFAKTRSGFVVDINAVIAFLPGSQVDSEILKHDTSLLGQKEPMMVIHLDEKLRNVVVSRKAVRDLARKDFREAFLDKLQEGDIIDGVVKNITPYGAFVNLGDIDGLLHVTDISWEKVGHPAEVLRIGQKVKVKVLKFSRAESKISLGMKQLEDNPWTRFEERYKIGTIVKGKITNIMNYGLFVQIEDGVEGLVHLSELSWNNDGMKRLKEDYKIGQEIESMVLEINIEKHRIALGVKQLSQNPWKEFEEQYKPGDILDGKIVNITDFGIFVSLNDKIDGLIASGDIAWGLDGKIPDKYKLGDVIKIVYLEGNSANQKVRLGIKQLHEDKIAKSSQLKVGSSIDCTLTQKRYDGCFVEMLDGSMSSFIRKHDLGSEGMDSLQQGQIIKAKITSYNEATKKITLSVKEFEDDTIFNSSSSSSSTLGSMIK